LFFSSLDKEINEINIVPIHNRKSLKHMETGINKLVETDIEISSLVAENSWPKYS
jgi:hypothetical protein